MQYTFPAILILLFCLLAFCVRPVDYTALKIDTKDYIIPPKKPGAGIDNAGWNEIK